MVQIDVLWSYAIGAGMATASSWRLTREPRRPDPALTATVMYCAVLFAPSGVWLLWGFPEWETMQVASGHAAVPPWLVALFALTNVTQAVAGHLVTRRLLRAGRAYAALAQTWLAYAAMFFVLVHGWDGRGYQRFLSADREAFARWPAHPSLAETAERAVQWIGSPVARTLCGLGVVVLVLVAMTTLQLRDGRRDARPHLMVDAALILAVPGLAFLGALGVCLGVHLLGWWPGVPVAVLVVWTVMLRPGTGPLHVLYRRLGLAPASGHPAARRAAPVPSQP